MDSWNLLLQIVLLLSVSLVLGVVLTRFKQSPIIGYLIAGMFLGGPGSFAILNANEHIQVVAELGVSLLLFSLGLEFSWKRLKSLGLNSLAGGVLQVTLTAAVASIILYIFNCEIREAIVIGAMVSLSSTACVLRILMERAESDSSHGRNAIAILLVQDIAVVAHAILLTLLTKGGSFLEVSKEVFKTLSSVGLLALFLYILINKVAVKALAKMTLDQNRELAILLAVAVGLGSTWAAHAIGISPALGAFAAGMFLGSSAFATQVRADISSIKIALLSLFFSSSGMVADPIWIYSNLTLVFISTFGLMIAKTITISLILLAIKQPISMAFATGATLSQIGEFAFVLGAIGLNGNIIRQDSYQLLISVAIFSLFLTPFVVSFAPKLGFWIATKFKKDLSNITNNSSEVPRPDILIIGFGPSAKAAIKSFINTEHKISVIDLNQISIVKAEKLGFKALLGDARQVDVLEHAGIFYAHTILITLPDYRTASTVLGQVRKMAKNAKIIVRSRYHRNIEIFRKKGADFVIGDEEAVGKKLEDVLVSS